MELYGSWLQKKKQIELVTLMTTSIAIELRRPKTHKGGEHFSTMARMT